MPVDARLKTIDVGVEHRPLERLALRDVGNGRAVAHGHAEADASDVRCRRA